jgi:5-methylcytosine-specific restriction protein A
MSAVRQLVCEWKGQGPVGSTPTTASTTHTASRTAFYCEKQREQLAHAQEGNTHLTGDCMAKAPQQHKRPAVGKTTAHKRSVRYKPREDRASSGARGYGHRWTKFRAAFLMRNPLCEYCKARGQVKAADICDHDLPHEHDPDLFWNNTFTALCKWDHDSTKQRMERRYNGDDLLRAVRVAKGQT